MAENSVKHLHGMNDKHVIPIFLNDFFETHKDDVIWTKKSSSCFMIHSVKWDTTIRVDLDKVQNLSAEELEMVLTDGKNVEQMTRVTGYFSKVAGWNKGKTGELKSRYRITRGGIV